MADLVASDTGSVLEVTCIDDEAGTPIDLTGATVRLKYKIGGGSLVTKTMTVSTPTDGKATYQFGSSELTAGTMTAEVEITDSGGKVLTSKPTFFFEIRAKVA